MRRVSRLSAVAVFCFATCQFSPAFAAAPAGKKVLRNSPGLLHEQIAPPTERFPRCHCSSIVQVPSGDLLTCWYAGEDEARPDVALVVSRKANGAKKWSKPEVVADVPGKPEGNAILFMMPDGVLWLVYGVMQGKLDGPHGPGVRWVTCDVRCRTSKDEGRTWSDIRMLQKDLGTVVRNKPIVMDNGELIFGVEYKDSQSRFWITGDNGRTWHIAKGLTGVANEQPTLIQRKDGSLLAFLRPGLNAYIARTVSTDHGRTWSTAKFTKIPNPYAAVDMVKLRDGRLVLAYNNSMRKRSPLTLAISEDEGRTWPHKRDLITDPGEYSYPAVIQDGKGKLHVTYTHKRVWIGHFRLSPDWIKGGKTK